MPEQIAGSSKAFQGYLLPLAVRLRPVEIMNFQGFVAPWRFKSSRPHHFKANALIGGRFCFARPLTHTTMIVP